MNEALHGLVQQRLRRISQLYTDGRREVVELCIDHRLDVLGACSACQDQGPAGTVAVASAVAAWHGDA